MNTIALSSGELEYIPSYEFSNIIFWLYKIHLDVVK